MPSFWNSIFAAVIPVAHCGGRRSVRNHAAETNSVRGCSLSLSVTCGRVVYRYRARHFTLGRRNGRTIEQIMDIIATLSVRLR